MTTTRNSSASRRLLTSEKLPWAFCVACKSLTFKLKSKIAGILLQAPLLHLGPGCVLRGTKYIRLGRNMYVHGHLWLEAVAIYREQQFSPQLEIDDNVSFSEGVHVSCIERVLIGKGVLFGSHVYVSDHNHGTYKGRAQSHPDEPPAWRALGGGGPVKIGDNVWVGDNAIIVGPVTIGRGAIIAANSVVRDDVPEFTMVGGIPAKPLRRFEQASQQWVKT